MPGGGALYQVAMQAESLRNVGDWKDISYLEAIVRAYTNGLLGAALAFFRLGRLFSGHLLLQSRAVRECTGGPDIPKHRKEAFSGYRFHDDDPVFFRQGLRLTCRCGEELNGAMLHDPPATVFTTYTWIYQW